MTLYFKISFKPYFDLCRSKRKKQPISDFILKYVTECQPGLLNLFANEEQRQTYIEMLKMLMFCHRH
jgi:hypothetical protein